MAAHFFVSEEIMAVLKVTRDTGYADLLRAYAVMLDGKKIGELKNGESKSFQISPGPHSISMKIDWCGSKTLQFQSVETEPAAFKVSSNLRGLRLLIGFWYILFDQSSYLAIERSQA